MEQTLIQQTLNQLNNQETQELQTCCRFIDNNGELCKGSYYSLPLYDNTPAKQGEIVALTAYLMQAFPQLPIGFYEVLQQSILNKQMSIAHLQAAIDHVLNNNHYSTFTIADIVDFDNHIKVASDVATLRHLYPKRTIHYNDIVVIRYTTQNNEQPMFVLEEQIQNAPYQLPIIGRWNDELHAFEIYQQVHNYQVRQRQENFRKQLNQYIKTLPPNFTTPQIVEQFFQRYAAIVGFGDRLFYETLHNTFNLTEYFNTFAQKQQQNKL